MATQPLYNNAELAVAAYADLDESKPTNDDYNLDKLELAGMSERQAKEFAARYPEVVAVYPTDAEGFSAAVFKSASPDGQLTIAIRGTDQFPGADADDDAFIFGSGMAYDQIVSMYNWWSDVSVSDPVLSAALSNDPVVNVTGHSLGGHLAMAFSSLFATQAGQVYTFNAPGFADSSGNQFFLDNLVSGAVVPISGSGNIRGQVLHGA